MAVALSAKDIGAVAAFKCIIGSLIKSFRMKRKRNFPDYKNDNCAGTKAPCEKSGNKNKGREHHHMVPVKNPAGCAAAVFHKPYSERAPEKNADKVTDIKSNGEKKKHVSSDDSGKIENTNNGTKSKPCKTDFYGIAVAFFYVFHKVLNVTDVFYFGRDKILDAEFCGTDGQKFSAGENLEKHIIKPDKPKDMKNGKTFKKVPTAHNIILLRSKNQNESRCNKCKTSEQKLKFVYFSEFGYNSFYGKHFIPLLY